MTCLYGVIVRLEIYGVVMVNAIFEGDLLVCCRRCRAETCVRVCKIDPAASNDLVRGVGGFEIDNIVILRTAADPVGFAGFLLRSASGKGRERRVGNIYEHCAHHQCVTALCVVRTRVLNGSSGDIYLDRALDNRVVRDIAGEHRACRGGTASKRIAPVFNTGHIAVNSSRAGCRIAHRQRICISLRLIRGRPAVQRSPAAVRVVLNGNGCHIVNILFSCGIAIQIIAEPLVQNAVIAFLADQQ